MNLFPGFENLLESKRVKFLEISGSIYVYNVKDSVMWKIDNLPAKYSAMVIPTVNPPVKTLIIHTTYKCNLNCVHCYLKAGKSTPEEMDSNEISRIIKEFGEMGGLQVDISGGEALLKPGIEDIILTARNQSLRTVILTNAENIDTELLKRISNNIDGVAIGLDGLYDANDEIRGKGTFENIEKNLKILRENNIDISFTTLLTKKSIAQLLHFPEFIQKYGGTSWSLVMPRPSGRYADHRDEIAEVYDLWEKAKQDGILNKLYLESLSRKITVILDHILVPGSKKKIDKESVDFIYKIYNKGRACWDNTLTIMPNGDVKCCLFFDDQIYDNVKNKSVRDVYSSQSREYALNEFNKYPVDKCPFLELDNLKQFSKKIIK